MDVRLLVLMMVVAIIMDFMGRMARKRVGEGTEQEEGVQGPGQGLPEGWELSLPRPEDGREGEASRAGRLPDPARTEAAGREARPLPAPAAGRREGPSLERIRVMLPVPPSPPPPPPPAPSAAEPEREPSPAPTRRERPADAAYAIERGGRDLGWRLGLGGADTLRRAVVIREVLGRPLALRTQDDREH